MIEAAREYRALGLSVIPVAQDKKPLVEWKPFQEEPAHIDQIDEWWTTWPTANVGAVTGKVSGLVVLDADGPEGLASLKALGTPATTWLSRTGRVEGGWQQFFRHPGDDVVVGNRAGLRPGLDVRGDGGYVVLPPSLHPSGRRYEWLTSPQDIELAPLSPSLLALLTTPPPLAMTTENGVIPQGQVDDLCIIVGVFIHWDATDDKKIFDWNYEAVKTSIARALGGEPGIDKVLADTPAARHPFAGGAED